MQQHLDQASHNQEFHDCIETQFTGKFYDWKITTLFYTAIHLLKALANYRGIDIGSTHQDIERNCNPDRPNTNMPINKRAWRDYKSLYRYSHTARYEGITDVETFELLMKQDHEYCKQYIEQFKKYIAGQGVPL